MEHQGSSDGLITREAIEKLCDVIEEEVESGDARLENSGTALSLIGQRPALKLHSDIVFSLYSAFSLLCCGFLLLWAAIVLPDVYVLIEAAFLILFCILNLFLSGWNYRLKQRELIRQAKSLLKELRDVLSSGEEWTLDDYLPIHSPRSSSVSLQWTFRDGQLVNLPQVLLVEGDVLLVRPGKPLPGDACKFQDHTVMLKAGETFLPEPPEAVTEATVRVPLQQEKFILLETPYRKYLRECIQKGNSRPVTMLENRRLMGTYLIERIVTPVIVITSLLVNVIRLTVIPEDSGHWAEMLIILQVNVILSLCPLAFPLMWIVLNHYGVGRLVALFHISRLQRMQHDEKLEFLEDQDIPDRNNIVSWMDILRHSWSSFTGNSSHLPRTSNLLHGLGTVTSFSCVDKQGILSYPDPTIEKVFFMSNTQEPVDQLGSKNSVLTEDSQLGKSGVAADWPLSADQEDLFPQSHAELLTVSMNVDSPTGLQFDEPDWEKHLSSLKPMGLNILLNACHPETEDNYLQFLDHCLAVTSSALKQSPFCPQRRCLCQGSYLMGFSDQATSQYMIEQQIAMYKVMATERRSSSGGSLRSQSFIQRRNPLPHALSVVVQDNFSGNFQVMTQGTAQLVLALCEDFWDGQDLHPLSDSDRKKIFDFYQRAMLSSYCSVLAYQPAMDYLPEYEDNLYIELPPGFGKHAHAIKETASLEVVRSAWDVRANMSPKKNGSDLPRARKCRSLDSAIDSLGRLPAGEECLRAMSGQIFIGMVTTNFQPKTDILTLIDQLDQACIRFVHFSEDQVLRSKVFAEKMGLEAGWNCHISLQSPSNDVRSLSHSNSGQVSHHASQCSSAGIDQIEMDIDAQRVRFKEDSCGNVQADTVAGSEEKERSHQVVRTKATVNQADLQVKLEVVENTSSDVTESSELLSEMKAAELMEQTETSENVEGDKENPPEWHPLIEQGSKEGDESRGMNFRQRQISETQTCSDGTDVDTTDSVPGGWDVSNRARLPRGVENIRPHIETIDNVPLQVPLFTDVTPETTKEMIQIMQENNEVVCCLGSSVNITNINIFAQADFSIGLEPLYPHICLQKEGSREEVRSINRHYLPPMELAAILTSLPCSVYFHRNDHISISAIVEEARVLCQGITNCFSFFVFAILTISAINFVSSLFLPPPLSGRHILWLSVFVAPWLSLSLVGSPGSSKIMRWSTGKNMDKTDCKNILLLFACFLAKFGGIIAVSLVCHALTLNSLCLQMHQNTTDCHPIYGNRNYTSTWNGLMDEAASHLALSQNLIMFFITLYLVIISSSFVHPLMSLWKQTPVSNGLWCAISAVIMVLALVLLLVVTPFVLNSRDPPVALGDVPLPVWLVGCIWPIPNLWICEAVKVLEIREYDRWQRRSKLLFDTKLGMNSPF